MPSIALQAEVDVIVYATINTNTRMHTNMITHVQAGMCIHTPDIDYELPSLWIALHASFETSVDDCRQGHVKVNSRGTNTQTHTHTRTHTYTHTHTHTHTHIYIYIYI